MILQTLNSSYTADMKFDCHVDPEQLELGLFQKWLPVQGYVLPAWLPNLASVGGRKHLTSQKLRECCRRGYRKIVKVIDQGDCCEILYFNNIKNILCF